MRPIRLFGCPDRLCDLVSIVPLHLSLATQDSDPPPWDRSTHLNVRLLGRVNCKPLVEGVQLRDWSLIVAGKLFLARKLSSTNNWQFNLGRERASSFSKWSLSRLGCGPAQTIPLCWHVSQTIRRPLFVIYLTLPIRSLIISSNFRIRKLLKMVLVFSSKVLLKTILISRW